MNRGDLTDEQWNKWRSLLPKRKKTGRPAEDDRRVINGILWILRTGAPWRDLPERYGKWGTVSSRFYRWRQARVFDRLFAAVQQEADALGHIDWQVHFVDGTVIRAHQHAAGSKKKTRAPKP
jgi:transposase